MNNSLFFLLAKPFVSHLNGAFLIILFFVLSYLLFCYFYKDKIKDKKILNGIIITGAVVVGIYCRLCLAGFTLGNWDMFSYEVVAKIISKGENVYLNTKRYNYSPVWFNILLGLYKFKGLFPLVEFRFIVRAFLTLVDLTTLLVLYKISKVKKFFFPPIAVGFFLNPISIIITGHHGQFENLTILLILSGVYFYLRDKQKTKKERIKLPAFLFLSAGIVKHIIINQVLAFYSFIFKEKKKVILAFSLSVFIFLASFIPYWPAGRQGIIKHVFLYRSSAGSYGISLLLKKISPVLVPIYTKIFILFFFFFAFSFKTKRLSKTVLINSLVFLGFAPGMCDQYLILPVAIASLQASPSFFVYTLIMSFYLFQSPDQLHLEQYSFVSSKVVWVISFLWFVLEFLKPNENKS